MKYIFKLNKVSEYFGNLVQGLREITHGDTEERLISNALSDGKKSDILAAVNRLVAVSGGMIWLDGQL